MPGGSTTGAPDWRDAAKLRKFLAEDIPQWTPSEGAENTRAFLAALREKCSTGIGAMTGLLLALFEERVDASKAGYELAQKLKRGGGGATPREELDMEMLFGDTKDFESAASVEVKTEQVDWTPELEAKWRAQVKGVSCLKLRLHSQKAPTTWLWCAEQAPWRLVVVGGVSVQADAFEREGTSPLPPRRLFAAVETSLITAAGPNSGTSCRAGTSLPEGG